MPGRPQHPVKLRLLPAFAGFLRENIRMRASFSKILVYYTSEESLINADYDKKNLSDFSFKEVSGVGKPWNDRNSSI